MNQVTTILLLHTSAKKGVPVMHYSEPLGCVYVLLCNIHALLELWVHKACNLYCGKSGWWYWPRSCNCPHLRL